MVLLHRSRHTAVQQFRRKGLWNFCDSSQHPRTVRWPWHSAELATPFAVSICWSPISTPVKLTERPRNSTFCLKNSHFLGLNFSPYFRNRSKIRRRLSGQGEFWAKFLKLAHRPKIARAIFQLSLLRTRLMAYAKVARALHKSNPMRVYSNRPWKLI